MHNPDFMLQLLVNLALRRKIRAIDMAKALKSVE